MPITTKLAVRNLLPLELPLAISSENSNPVGGSRLKKPVDTLAMTPREGGRISVIERKLYFTLMWFAQKQGWVPGQECFKALLSDVLKKMSYSSKNMAVIREALASMVTTRVEWQSPTLTEGSNWGVSGMISDAEIRSLRTGSTIEWSYSSKIRPSILEPFPYARGSFEVQDVIRSYSGLAMYDICSRYFSSPTGLTPKRHWLWWRPVLTGGSDGLDIDPQFKAFNRDVLKKAIAEVNLHAHFDVRLILHKVGQKVSDIQFQATRKISYKPPLLNIESESGLKEIGRAIASGISQKQAELLFVEHGEENLSRSMDALEVRQKKTHLPHVKEPKAYLLTVINNQPLDLVTGALGNIQKEDALEKQKRLILLDQFRANRLEEVWQLFSESIDKEKEMLIEQFRLEVLSKLPPSSQRLFEQKGFQAVSIRSLMRNFLAVNMLGELWNKPSDEEFLKFTLLHSVV